MSFENALIEHASPVLAKLKPANLFRYSLQAEESIGALLRQWNWRLRHKGIAVTSLKRCKRTGCYLIYVYRPSALAAILSQPSVRSFLISEGYPNSSEIFPMLSSLARRICLNKDFPHEIGVFLGYPLADVTGFIKHKGKNFVFCGFWKVYSDKSSAVRRFQSYRLCTEEYKRRFEDGCSIMQLAIAS